VLNLIMNAVDIVNKYLYLVVGTHAAWPAAVLNSGVYQLHNPNAFLHAGGPKDLKELAIFTGQQNEGGQVGRYLFIGRTLEGVKLS